MNRTPNDALDRAIQIIGSQKALADLLQIKPPSISEWIRRGSVPANRCRVIEAATQGRVTVYELRPDVFGATPADRSAA